MQSVYADRVLPAYPGQRIGFAHTHKANSCKNDSGSSRKTVDVVLATAAEVAQTQVVTVPGTVDNSATYHVIINGTDITYLTDASATQAELRDGLIAAINASDESDNVTATASGNNVLVTADDPGTAFTLTVGTATTNDLALGAATENTGAGTVRTFTVNGVSVSYTEQEGDTLADIRDGLIEAFYALTELEGVATANGYGNNVRITAAEPGVDITVAESDGRVTLTVVQANVASQFIPFGRVVVAREGADADEQSAMLPSAASQTPKGVSEMVATAIDATNGPGIAPFTMFSALYEGDIWVESEVAVDKDDDVYFRHTANGALSALGKVRNDADTANADQLTGAKFLRTTTAAGLVPIRLNRP